MTWFSICCRFSTAPRFAFVAQAPLYAKAVEPVIAPVRLQAPLAFFYQV